MKWVLVAVTRWPPGGGADDADFVGGDVPLGGLGADEGNGALGIFKGHGCFAVIAFAMIGNAVFQEHAGDALAEFSHSQISVPSRSMARI